MNRSGATIARAAPAEEESLGELLSRLAADAKTLVRAEVEVYKLAVVARVDACKGAAVLLVLGALLALASFGALLVGLAIALGQVIGMLGGALVVGLGGMVVGGLLAYLAVRRISRALSTDPRKLP